MPNHVTNIIEIKGDPARVKALFEAVKSDEYGPEFCLQNSAT